jgi:hypothetical protein
VYVGAVAGGVAKTLPVKVTVVFDEIDVTGFKQSVALLTVNVDVGAAFTVTVTFVMVEVHPF